MRCLDNEVELADLHHRLITRTQLRQTLSADQVRRRIEQGQLHPVIPGVFCLDPPSDEFLFRAAALCLRCPEGFVSGTTSARYWGLRRGRSNVFEFTVPPHVRPRGLDFALLRFARVVEEDEIFVADGGIRVSIPARAAFECASRLDEFGLRSLVESGLHQGLFDQTTLQTIGERLCSRGRGGTRLFRRVIDIAEGTVPVHSEVELLLLDAVRAAGLDDATPQFPVKLASGFTVHVDVGIPSARLAAEVDGPLHDQTIAVHRDKSRDRQVAVQGWQVMRIPADDVRQRLRLVTAQVVAVARQRATLFAPRP